MEKSNGILERAYFDKLSHAQAQRSSAVPKAAAGSMGATFLKWSDEWSEFDHRMHLDCRYETLLLLLLKSSAKLDVALRTQDWVHSLKIHLLERSAFCFHRERYNAEVDEKAHCKWKTSFSQ